MLSFAMNRAATPTKMMPAHPHIYKNGLSERWYWDEWCRERERVWGTGNGIGFTYHSSRVVYLERCHVLKNCMEFVQAEDSENSDSWSLVPHHTGTSWIRMLRPEGSANEYVAGYPIQSKSDKPKVLDEWFPQQCRSNKREQWQGFKEFEFE